MMRIGRGKWLCLLLLLTVVFRPAGKAALAADDFDFNNLNAAQQRQIFAPQMVSGDDIREGKIEQRRINVSRMLRGEEKQDEYARRLARLESQVNAGQPGGISLVRNGGGRFKAGILFAAAVGRHPALDSLLPQLPALMSQAGFVPVPREQLQTVLNNFRYRQLLRDPGAISRFLAEYPGTRFLFFLQNITYPGRFPGQLTVAYQVADGVSGQVYPPAVLSTQVYETRGLSTALRACLAQMLARGRGLAAGLPWQAKVFLVQGNLVYLSAGRLSGLQVGDRLEVAGGQRPIRDPRTGMVVGQVPGPPKALIQVRRFFGYDLAEAVLVQGGGVRMGDLAGMAK